MLFFLCCLYSFVLQVGACWHFDVYVLRLGGAVSSRGLHAGLWGSFFALRFRVDFAIFTVGLSSQDRRFLEELCKCRTQGCRAATSVGPEFLERAQERLYDSALCPTSLGSSLCGRPPRARPVPSRRVLSSSFLWSHGGKRSGGGTTNC